MYNKVATTREITKDEYDEIAGMHGHSVEKQRDNGYLYETVINEDGFELAYASYRTYGEPDFLANLQPVDPNFCDEPDDDSFLIIWPENRVVTRKQMEVWFDDAVANNDLTKDDVCGHGSVGDKAMALHRVGLITLLN